MTIQRQDEETADGSGQRTAVAEGPPIAAENGNRQATADDQLNGRPGKTHQSPETGNRQTTADDRRVYSR